MFPPSKRHQSPSRKSGTKKYVEKSSKVTVIMEQPGPKWDAPNKGIWCLTRRTNILTC